eukprot:UN12150
MYHCSSTIRFTDFGTACSVECKIFSKIVPSHPCVQTGRIYQMLMEIMD